MKRHLSEFDDKQIVICELLHKCNKCSSGVMNPYCRCDQSSQWVAGRTGYNCELVRELIRNWTEF